MRRTDYILLKIQVIWNNGKTMIGKIAYQIESDGHLTGHLTPYLTGKARLFAI